MIATSGEWAYFCVDAFVSDPFGILQSRCVCRGRIIKTVKPCLGPPAEADSSVLPSVLSARLPRAGSWSLAAQRVLRGLGHQHARPESLLET